MIPELGHFSLIIGLCLALVLSIVPMVGVYRNDSLLMAAARPLAGGQFFFVLLSFICLCYAFATDDFSVAYVAANSNTKLPTAYKVAAVWGAHEGSWLLWILFLTIWTFAVSIFSRQLPFSMLARVLSVLGWISVGFILFALLTSNPFDRYLPNFPSEGNDLNPLLQDFGQKVHPPMLYLGYVGLSVAFAFAVAALMSGKLDAAWARWSRPWTNIAWGFLTFGIILGSWWAYYELGWGGWWFWDPVENGSFMPWLLATALIHSLAVTEKRGVFKSWTVLLAIAAFALVLVGAFIVRSGILTSVHSFAVDSERGMYLLIFLVLVIGGSLALYALRAPAIRSHVRFDYLSREIMLLINNVLLVLATAIVFIGTISPLVYELITDGQKMSIGPPYFNFMFTKIAMVLMVFLGIGPIVRWKKTSPEYLKKQLYKVLLASILLGIIVPIIFIDKTSWLVMLVLALVFWLILTHLKDVYQKTLNKKSLLTGLKQLSPSYWGMQLAHIGVAVMVVGVCITSVYSTEKDVKMSPGEVVDLGAYSFHFNGVKNVKGPNYSSSMGSIDVWADGEKLFEMRPEKRLYHARGQVMTEADIDPGLSRDIYVALGDELENGAWAVRLHYKPFVRCIWLGGMMAGFGGVLSVMDRRYRVKLKNKAKIKGVSALNPANA